MILYITKLEKGNIGTDMHYKALCDIFGRENIFFYQFESHKKRTSFAKLYLIWKIQNGF